MTKKKPDKDGIVFSTNPDFSWDSGGESKKDTPDPGQQRLWVQKETKNRRGKIATLVEGFIGKPDDLEELGKKLKTFCGTGGSVKDGMIIIQGDQRAKTLQWLIQNGYTRTRQA